MANKLILLSLFLLPKNNLYSMENQACITINPKEIAFPLAPEIYEKTLKELLENPLEALMEAQSSAEHSLYGLSECTNSQCKMSRIKFPHIRQKFVEYGTKLLEERYSQKEPFSIGFLASGNLFSETELISHILQKDLLPAITIVDPVYKKNIEQLVFEKKSLTYEVPALQTFIRWLASFKNPISLRICSQVPPAPITDWFAIDPFQGESSVAVLQEIESIKRSLPTQGQITVLQEIASQKGKLPGKDSAVIETTTNNNGNLKQTEIKISRNP